MQWRCPIEASISWFCRAIAECVVMRVPNSEEEAHSTPKTVEGS
ncbi:MAG: hypothetical protein AAFR31_05035 [Cyanobacteria bacterium J06627_8]